MDELLSRAFFLSLHLNLALQLALFLGDVINCKRKGEQSRAITGKKEAPKRVPLLARKRAIFPFVRLAFSHQIFSSILANCLCPLSVQPHFISGREELSRSEN